MRRRYRPGEAVRAGTYWNSKTWEFVTIAQDGEALPTREGVSYYRAPLPLVFVAGPFVGLAFIVFLPIAVPALLIYRALVSAARAVSWAFRRAGEGRARAGH
ncbi:MAG: hypothetical protein Q8P22_01725 [Chloroflexota bacterium]|nr:hypothetical protein [Chloroflexota bacterium]